VQSLVIDPAKRPHGDNVKRDKLRLLARPYPRAVAGTPQSFGFDPATGEFDLRYSVDTPDGGRLRRGIDTEVFVPRVNYKDGYEVSVTGADVVSQPGARVLRLEREPGAGTVAVTVTRR
jgi:endoglycosylceramidase